LDFDDGPAYSSGQRPPVADDHMVQDYNMDESDHPRPSVSYDAFVGSQHHQVPLPGGPGAPASGHARPGYLTESGRMYSQTAELQNYERYADLDELHDYEQGYYSAGGQENDTPGLPPSQGRRTNRNSVLGMGGGIMGRAKAALGMGPQYSEMDVPLTEPGQEEVSLGDTGHDRPKAKASSGFKFGFGRRKPDPSTLGPRIILLNNPPANAANKYCDNHISTAKYNVATFMPKFLFEQFSKYANVFFLFTAGLQQVPNISPTNPYTTIVPLGIVLLVSAGRELIEDYKRKTSDKSLNHAKTRALRGNQFEDIKWVNVAVGDILQIRSEEPIPADMVLLATSEPEGLCYIETANLDGETNLKIKQAIPETANLVNPADLSRMSGRIKSEQPNSSLYTYEAALTIQVGGGEKELSLQPDQLLLRGAVLRNTQWAYGIVVTTGHETKLMRNATATPIKRTDVERRINLQILMLVGILLVLSLISTVGDLDYTSMNNVKQFFSDLATYWILYSNLVPISLFVTIELVKYWHAILINSDLDMYYDKTDTPAVCRTSSLVEELGQIEYVFSDKTGTLTCNIMEFRQCTIGGLQYADQVPEEKKAGEDGTGFYDFKQLRNHLRIPVLAINMSYCHS